MLKGSVKGGDIMDKYINKVIYGDCLEVLRELPDESVDTVITDPPYRIDLQPQRKKTTSILGDKPDEARILWASCVTEVFRILKPNTASLFWSGWSEVWVKDILDQYFKVKSCIVWVKNNFGIGYYTRPQHEFAWYCHKGKPPKPKKAESNVWYCNRLNKPVHSCQKPTELMEKAIKLTTKPGDVVLDPFLGSGTTAIAALKTGRYFIGIEKEPKYVEIANKRIQEFMAQNEIDVRFT